MNKLVLTLLLLTASNLSAEEIPTKMATPTPIENRVPNEVKTSPVNENKIEIACGSYEQKDFPFTLVIRNKDNELFMTLARGKTVLLRTKAEKLVMANSEYATQFSAGPNFYLNLDSKENSGIGYLRAKYENENGSNLVAGEMNCKKI